ncbi:MAG TPA: cysteine desulfurase, partial [Holophaga sp.]|nr:cysteine desulfurase [Holophaga sp.]
MDVQRIRVDFPILREVIYLDSASTSLTPEPVLQAVLDYYRGYKANVGRGVYRLAQLADQRYRDAHRKAAEFVGAKDAGSTVFTRNTTESINIVARGLDWKRGDRVVTTLMEHHSNLLPWMRLKRRGVELKIVPPDPQGVVHLSDLERMMDERTRLVATSQVSNVLGTELPIKGISRLCRERGAALLVDGAQSVPHMPVNVADLDCDYLCFSGHKMLGPTGTGVLWMRKEEEIEPLLAGGGMVEDVSPGGFTIKKGYEGFEAGTPDISGGIGLGAAVDYLEMVG